MNVAYHAADVTLRVGPAIALVFFLAGRDVLFYFFFVLKEIAMVNRLYFTDLRAFNIRVTKCELTN